MAGEVGTLVKGVHRAGLIRGVMGYLKRDENVSETSQLDGDGRG